MDNDTSLATKLIDALLLLAGGLALFYILFFIIKKWAKSKTHALPRLLNEHLHFAGVALFIVIAIAISITSFQNYFSKEVYNNLLHFTHILLILSISFLIIKVITFFRDLLLSYYSKKEYKDYRLRSARTKFQIIERLINVMVIIGTIAAVLMTFEQVKQIGSTLLASAGVAGIVLGFAAQRSLSTLFAGIQIAISQPVKLDDIVVVEGQFGTVGEISLTYVVLNTWDEKRLIIPINYFLEHSFENWTRSSPEVVAKVKIYADYTLPVESIRKEFLAWVHASPLWDKRKAALLVTDADDKTILVRATMSVRNSDDAFDLECYIREKLITFIRENYPNSLPTSRLDIKNTVPSHVQN
jgi:small-conductance mechanosensitive channel